MPRPFTLADLSPDVLDMSAAEFARLQGALAPEKFEIVVLDALVNVARAKLDRVPLVSAGVATLDDRRFIDFLTRHQAVLKPMLPADDAVLAARLQALMRGLPDAPGEFSERLDLLVAWQTRLPRVAGPDVFTSWQKLRGALRDWARERENKLASSGFFGRMGRGKGSAGGAATLPPELARAASLLSDAMPRTEYPDPDGTRKLKVLESLSAVYAKTESPLGPDVLALLAKTFAPPPPPAPKPTPSTSAATQPTARPVAAKQTPAPSASAAVSQSVTQTAPPKTASVVLTASVVAPQPAAATATPPPTLTAIPVGPSAPPPSRYAATAVPAPTPDLVTQAGLTPAGAAPQAYGAAIAPAGGTGAWIIGGAIAGGVLTLAVVGLIVYRTLFDDVKPEREVARVEAPSEFSVVVESEPIAEASAVMDATTPATPAIDWPARVAELRAKREALRGRPVNTVQLNGAQAMTERAFTNVKHLAASIASLRQQAAAGAKPDRAMVEKRNYELALEQTAFNNNLFELRRQAAASASAIDLLVADMEALVEEVKQARRELMAPVPRLREFQTELNDLTFDMTARLDDLKKLQLPPDRFDAEFANLTSAAKKDLEELTKFATAMDPLPALITADGKGRYEVTSVRPFQTSNEAVAALWTISWKTPPTNFALRLHRPKDAAIPSPIALQRFEALDGTDAERSLGVLNVRLANAVATEAQFRLRRDGTHWNLVLNWIGHSGSRTEPNSVYAALAQHVLEFWTPDGSWYVVFHPAYVVPALARDQNIAGDRTGALRFQLNSEQRRQAEELKLAGGEVMFERIEPIERDTVRTLLPRPPETTIPVRKLETNPNFRWPIAKPEMGVFAVKRLGNDFSIEGLAAAASIPAQDNFPMFISIPTTIEYPGFRDEKEVVQARDGNGQLAFKQITVPDPTPRNPRNVKVVDVPIMKTVIVKVPVTLTRPGDPEIKELKQPRPTITLTEATIVVGEEKSPLGVGPSLLTFTPHIVARIDWPGGVVPAVHPAPADGSLPKPEDRAKDLMTNLAKDQAAKLPTWIKAAVKSFSGVLYYELDDGTPIEYVRIGTTREPVALPLKPTAPLAPPLAAPTP